MTKVILISQLSLPYPKIGSWTTLYHNYLNSSHAVNYIICPQPETLYPNVEYKTISNSLYFKIQRRYFKKRYLNYFQSLEKIINTDEKFIIQIVDNFGIVKPLLEFLEKKGKRNKCYVQFFYHGFPPFHENFHGRWFYESIDEMILLTNDSYLAHKNYYTVLPTRFSVLHNGIDTNKFYAISNIEKESLKAEKKLLNKKIFIWCSQDRPKKGLNILLNAWKRVYETHQDIVLWVIGCEPKNEIKGVEYLGIIPNDELPKYYQMSDCYLFTTLCHEGFGLSLIEALHCGNHCIASSIGGVSEVLQYGKLGKLIDKPHFEEEWTNAMLEFLDNSYTFANVPSDLYSSQSWNYGMNKIISDAKRRL
ncbi:glycosyltransferase family 4 protein [Flavobacterium ginsengiterrae]|uniref:Glycosyl transferase family 1 domain-containing protein n=1 Tax=Flavobacterium ginsengiterrae TaxID=871695 RepID=A0ABP7H6C2_9FLAO